MKVFIYRPTSESVDCAAVVYSEEGEELGFWISSSPDWARNDTAKFIPEGAEVVWCYGRVALQARIDAGEIRNLSFEAKEGG